MKRASLLSLTLKGSGALAWLAYTWALTHSLPPHTLGIVLTALALSGPGSDVLSAGWAQTLLRDGARAPQSLPALWHHALGGVALRTLVCLIPLTLLWGTITPALLILIAALILTLAILALLCARLRATGHLVAALLLQGPARLGGAFVLLPYSGSSADSILTGHLIACLVLIPAALWLAQGTGHTQAHPRDLNPLTLAHLGQTLTQHLDVIAVALWLPPAQAATYLVARRIAGSLSLGFDALRMAFAPRLARAYGSPDFTPLARQANLFFATLGALGLTGLAIAAPWIWAAFSQAHAALPLLYALLAVHAAPALFGATGMLMTMARLEHVRARILWTLLPMAATAMALWGDTPLALALCTLGLTLVMHGSCAAYLSRRTGVRPIWA